MGCSVRDPVSGPGLFSEIGTVVSRDSCPEVPPLWTDFKVETQSDDKLDPDTCSVEIVKGVEILPRLFLLMESPVGRCYYVHLTDRVLPVS